MRSEGNISAAESFLNNLQAGGQVQLDVSKLQKAIEESREAGSALRERFEVLSDRVTNALALYEEFDALTKNVREHVVKVNFRLEAIQSMFARDRVVTKERLDDAIDKLQVWNNDDVL